jgi:3-hydroxyisobutyrate dehydrogenase
LARVVLFSGGPSLRPWHNPAPMSGPTIGLLGTGIMGAPMARNLAAAGMSVRAWNRTRERAEPLAADGVEIAGSPGEAVTGADVVITMLADTDAVLAATEGADGALAAMGEDAVWAQMSTVGVVGTDRLIALARERGVGFVDAPVLGTKAPAEQGKLVVLASGAAAELDRCAPAFEAVGARTMRVGDAGAGTRLKLVVNSWILAMVENVGETVALAQALGLDPHLWLEAMEGGAMDAPYAHSKTQAILEGNLEPSFRLALARKDIGLVQEAAVSAGLDLALPPTVAERFDRAITLGHGDEDMCAAYFASAPDGGPR